jgi:hypothetical protein
MKFLDRFRAYPELRTVIVNLKSGTAFRGVVWRRRGPFMILKNAELLKDKAGGSPLDGEVLVQQSDIDFIQVL